MDVILIKARDNTKREVEGMSKERRNKDKTFGFATSSSNPWICLHDGACRQTQVYSTCNLEEAVYELSLNWKLHSSAKPAERTPED